MDSDAVLRQLRSIISDLIRLSLCNHQNFPCEYTNHEGITEVSFKGSDNISIALKNQPYLDIYNTLLANEAYSVKMLDGALLQFLYRFHNNEIISHRLAFFPSPDLEEYQNNPEIYDTDVIFAEIIMKNVVTFPIRFDFDNNDELFIEIDHPKSHLTLGQYKNCRIPVSSPVSPYQFISFILRNFYNTAHNKFSNEINEFTECFTPTIQENETNIIHLRIS